MKKKEKEQISSLTMKCGCGKKHLLTNKKKWITVKDVAWRIDCYVNQTIKHISQLTFFATKQKLVLSKIKDNHPEINIDQYTLEVIRDMGLTDEQA